MTFDWIRAQLWLRADDQPTSLPAMVVYWANGVRYTVEFTDEDGAREKMAHLDGLAEWRRRGGLESVRSFPVSSRHAPT